MSNSDAQVGEGGGAAGAKPEDEKGFSREATTAIIEDRLKRDREDRAREEQDWLRKLGVSSKDEIAERLASQAGGGGTQAGGHDSAAEKRGQRLLRQASEKWETEKLELVRERDDANGLADRVGAKTAVRHAGVDAGMFDQEDAVRLIGHRVRLDPETEATRVYDEEGNLAFDGRGNPMTLKGAVEGLRSSHPHLFDASAKDGSGRTFAGGGNASRTITRADFDKKSPREQMTLMRERKVKLVD